MEKTYYVYIMASQRRLIYIGITGTRTLKAGGRGGVIESALERTHTALPHCTGKATLA